MKPKYEIFAVNELVCPICGGNLFEPEEGSGIIKRISGEDNICPWCLVPIEYD